MPAAITPPAPPVHQRDLPTWRILLEIGRNSVGIWSENALNDLIRRNHSLGISSILVSDPEAARHVLTTAADRYTRPLSVFRVTRPLAGDGLLLAEGGDWKRQRKMLAPLFAPANLNSIVPHFVEAGEALVRRLGGMPKADLSQAFQDAALDAVLWALFSTPLSEGANTFTAISRSYLQGAGRPSPLDGFARKEDDFAFASRSRRRFAEQRKQAVSDLIAARRLQSGTEARGDLLDLLLAIPADADELLVD